MNKQLILCPVDYSESTEMAISLAVDLARADNSRIVLLHVIEPYRRPISISESIDNRFQERLRKQYLDFFGVQHRLETRRGDPAATTIEYAKQIGADMIVKGTMGRTGLASLVVGSVVKKVMAGASCPVVTVKTPAKFTDPVSRAVVPAAKFAQKATEAIQESGLPIWQASDLR